MNKKIKLQVEPINLEDANNFVTNYHRHSKPIAHNFKFAFCATFGSDLVGVVIVGRPISRSNDDGWTLEVRRNCVRPDAPKNTCSFLYSRAWRIAQALGYHKLITYTLEKESGSSLKGAGFTMIGQVRQDTRWHMINGHYEDVYNEPKLKWGLSDGQQPNRTNHKVVNSQKKEQVKQDSLFDLLPD